MNQNSSPLYRIFGGPQNRGFRVMWLLEELEQNYEVINLDLFKLEHYSEEYLKINPKKKVPTLVYDEHVLSESFAIMLHLCEQHSDKELIPLDTSNRMKAFEWLAFFMTEIEASLWVFAKHTFAYPPKRRVEGILKTAQFEVKRAFAQLSYFLQEKKKSRAVESTTSNVEATPLWILDQFGLVDLCAGYLLIWSQTRGMDLDDETLQSYFKQIQTRPAYVNAQNKSCLSWNEYLQSQS